MGRCLIRLVNHPRKVGKDPSAGEGLVHVSLDWSIIPMDGGRTPPGVGVGRCLNRLVNHPTGLGVGRFSLSGSITPQV